MVTATGDVPNVQWLTASGLLTEGRLEIDEYCRVGPNIVAAGDVAFRRTSDGVQRSPLWTNAIEQAKTAAAALLSPETVQPLDFPSYFWTDQWGMSLKLSGPAPVTHAQPLVVKGELADRSAVLLWPDYGAAAALNIRMPIPRLHKLALDTLAVS